MAYTLPALPYAYDALEPHFDARTMEIHHAKHHQTYITNLNAALADARIESTDIDALIADIGSLPEGVRNAVRNNGGGHANHSLFWTVLTANGSTPEGTVAQAIDRDLGGYAAFKDAFTKAAQTRFGSGWAWLTLSRDGTLLVESGEQPEPGQPVDGRVRRPLRRYPDPRAGCVGTRVLPELPEPPPGLYRRLLRIDRLDGGRAALPGRRRPLMDAGTAR